MNERENFLTIEALSSKIDQKVRRIQKGEMKIQMLDALLDEVRDLQERLIILKYKSMEKLAKKNVEKKQIAIEKRESNPITGRTLQLDFGLEKKPEVSQNQISLIDSIAEIVVEQKVDPVIKSGPHSEPETKIKSKPQPEIQPETKASPEFELRSEPEFKPELKSIPEFEHLPEPEVKPEIKATTEPVEKKEPAKKVVSAEPKQTIGDKIKSKSIKDIHKEIKLNARLGIIKQLFKGKADDFKTAIDQLNDAEDLSAAKKHLTDLQKNGDWDMENKWNLVLTELVERRFL